MHEEISDSRICHHSSSRPFRIAVSGTCYGQYFEFDYYFIGQRKAKQPCKILRKAKGQKDTFYNMSGHLQQKGDDD
jgi:hypothetical protein